MSNKFNLFDSLNLSNGLDFNNSNNFINSFINDLQDYLSKIQSSKLLSKLDPYSLLTFAKFDGRFAVCFDYGAKKIYYVPKNKIVGNLPEPGEALKVDIDGTFYVDYTAILADENKIDDYLSECN